MKNIFILPTIVFLIIEKYYINWRGINGFCRIEFCFIVVIPLMILFYVPVWTKYSCISRLVLDLYFSRVLVISLPAGTTPIIIGSAKFCRPKTHKNRFMPPANFGSAPRLFSAFTSFVSFLLSPSYHHRIVHRIIGIYKLNICDEQIISSRIIV